MDKTVSVVSLAWNKRGLTEGFLKNLKNHTPFHFQLVFTDNGSSEPMEALVKGYFPQATVIVEKKNIGCPATRNEAMQHVTGDIVFWLDNDTYVNEGWYEPFLDALRGDVGIVGIDGRKIRNPFNPQNAWVFPNEMYDFYCDWFVGYAVAFQRRYYKEVPDWGLSINFDDVDLGLGIKANGMKALMLSDAPNLVHLGSQTGPAWKPEEAESDLFKRWWAYWQPYSQFFEEYK